MKSEQRTTPTTPQRGANQRPKELPSVRSPALSHGSRLPAPVLPGNLPHKISSPHWLTVGASPVINFKVTLLPVASHGSNCDWWRLACAQAGFRDPPPPNFLNGFARFARQRQFRPSTACGRDDSTPVGIPTTADLPLPQHIPTTADPSLPQSSCRAGLTLTLLTAI